MTDKIDRLSHSKDIHPIVVTSGDHLQASKRDLEFDGLIRLVTDGLTSDRSRAMYRKALTDFLGWYQDNQKQSMTKAVVNEYKAYLQSLNYAPSTINQRLSAIRKFAREASDNGLMDGQLADGITRVTGIKSAGVRIGNWLSKEQAQGLINTPDITTLKGLRDRAILAVMLGSGLRRSEVAGLTFGHIQQRDGRWVIVDLIGKGNRVRTVPIPSWVKQAIDEWVNTAGISGDRLFRSINKGDNLSGDSMTSQAIQDVVKLYADKCNFQLSAHDLRRTFAKLVRKGGADIMQIKLSLGHQKVETTERYLGETQNLSSAPCDVIGLHLE